MRILIVSDIHSNFVALETVLAVAGSLDQIWNLGDTIGYGPRPNECVTAIQQAKVMIAGNHDLASLGRVNLNDFNPDARTANIWNGEQLTPENRDLLDALPPRYDVDERFLAVHASPREPIWEYLLTLEQARENFAYFNSQVCFIGHSHVPLIFRRFADGRCEGLSCPMLARQSTYRAIRATSSTPAALASRATKIHAPPSRSSIPTPAPSSSTASSTISPKPSAKCTMPNCRLR